jgi:hypothetical protein
MAIIEEAAKQGERSVARGLREGASAWRGEDEATAAQQQGRKQHIERAVALMKEGLRLDGQRFTREEMHER